MEEKEKLLNDIESIVEESKVDDEPEVTKKLSKMHVYETQIENNKKKLLKDEQFYNDNDNCPTCKQDIGRAFKVAAIDSANVKIQEFNTALGTLEKEQNKLNERLIEIKDAQRRIGAIQTQLLQKNATVAHLMKYTDKLALELNDLKSKKLLSEDMTKISETLLNNLRGLQKDRGEIVESKQYHDIASTLLKDSGIKARIVKQYLPVINKLVNKYLAAMDFFVMFEIDEEFNETIKSRHRDNFSYGNFSEGEKMRIDLALLFTWRAIAKLKNSMNTNLLILDEVFDSSLDANGIDEILKLLDSFGTDTNVFVISHKGDVLLDKFRSVIKFEKINNFSRIS
jgi:DNA repair exonuclease SbcCD ATPase subunit